MIRVVLSQYTTFRYGALTVTPTAASDTTSLQPTKEKFEGAKAGASVYDIVYRATVTVQNTGTVAAKEVAQLYLSVSLLRNSFKRE